MRAARRNITNMPDADIRQLYMKRLIEELKHLDDLERQQINTAIRQHNSKIFEHLKPPRNIRKTSAVVYKCLDEVIYSRLQTWIDSMVSVAFIEANSKPYIH